MTTQHTPVPWMVEEPVPFNVLVNGEGQYHSFVIVGEHDVAIVTAERADDIATTAANAHLIAAAPTAPHDCDHDGCPGRETKRKLDAFAEMKEALEKVERWFGEFPDTGRKWDDGAPMSYSAVYGSNGERDYMRRIARAALQRATLGDGGAS